MSIRSIFRPLVPKSILEKRRKKLFDPKDYAFSRATGVATDIQSKYQYDGVLSELFAGNEGAVIDKWHHYIPIYDRYLSPYRGGPVKVLEIGVSKGGGLQMWRRYFGDAAVLFGVDIDPDCAPLDGQSGQVRIGSQADTAFLDRVIDEMGGVDIVLDDGSHQMHHLRASLEHLFPRLSDGGLYLIEDLHTAYYGSFGGGLRKSSNFFKYVREIIDDMHHWYHHGRQRHPAVSASCAGLHIHDSIVVLDKRRVFPPVFSRVG